VRAAAKEIAASLVNFLPLPTPPQSTALLPLPGLKPALGVSLTGAPIMGGNKLPPLPTMLISRNDVNAGLVGGVGGRSGNLKYPKFLPMTANNNNVAKSRRKTRSRRGRRRRRSSRSSRSRSRSRGRRSRSRSSYSKSSRSRSRSPSRTGVSTQRRTGSPTFKDKRRITRFVANNKDD
jgi:hypothetical protein